MRSKNTFSFESFLTSFTFKSFLKFVDQFDVIGKMILGHKFGTKLALSDLAKFE